MVAKWVVGPTNVVKYNVSCTDGNISVRIKIGNTFIFRLHARPIQLIVFVPVAFTSFLQHFLPVLLGFEVSSGWYRPSIGAEPIYGGDKWVQKDSGGVNVVLEEKNNILDCVPFIG